MRTPRQNCPWAKGPKAEIPVSAHASCRIWMVLTQCQKSFFSNPFSRLFHESRIIIRIIRYRDQSSRRSKQTEVRTAGQIWSLVSKMWMSWSSFMRLWANGEKAGIKNVAYAICCSILAYPTIARGHLSLYNAKLFQGAVFETDCSKSRYVIDLMVELAF
jgi:hypothetical protein